MYKLHNLIANSFRHLPRFRGKASLGIAIGRFLINASSNDDCLATITMRDGSIMRLDVRSRTEQWAYWTGEYDAPIISRISSCLQDDCTIFDVGANVGFYSTALGNNLRKLNGRLLAFEPVRSNFVRLMECVSLNGLENIVSTYNVALGNEEGTIELHMENDGNASTGNAVMMRGKVSTENKLTINASAPITRLDTFVQDHGIEACDFIKIDVEGAEVMFLRGGACFLSKHRPIIYGEFNPYWLKQFGHSFVDVANIVTPWNYRFFKQKRKQARFTEFTQPEVGIENVLLCPSETPNVILAALGVDL